MNKKCARLVGKITEKAVQITEKYEFAVFAEYSGHCDLIEVTVRKSKKEYNDFLSHDFVYASHQSAEELEERLGKIYVHLCHIYRTGKLPEDLTVNEMRYEGSVRLA